MALVNPNIAMSFRQPEFRPRNAMAEYAQMQQIQGGQQAQELARFQLGAAQRAENMQNALGEAYASSINEKGEVDYNKLLPSLAQRGGGAQIPGILKTRAETEAARLKQQETQGKIDTNTFDLTDKKLKAAWNLIGSSTSPQAAIAEFNKGVKNGVFKAEEVAEDLQLLGSMTKPEEFSAYLNDAIVKTLDAKGKLEQRKVTTKDTDRGGYIERQTYNAQGVAVGKPTKLNKTATIGETTAQGQLAVAQRNAQLAQEKFAFERANPGFELKEAEDGSIVAVNKRTLQAVPVTIGGAVSAAAAAPAAAGPGMPGPRVPVPAVQAQQAPSAAPMAGVPLRGKGTAMTESQSKSAMFGGAMNQANKVISDVEKKGTMTAPVAVSVLQGLARLTPQLLGSGENAASSIEALFRQDPTSLIGPDVNQQKLGQAQVAFATAYLRATSGAAFGPSEVANTIKEYFPLIGEDKTVAKQKAEARQRAIEGMKISTTRQGQSYIDKSGENLNDPLNLGIGGR
jgi:hypothetical protein